MSGRQTTWNRPMRHQIVEASEHTGHGPILVGWIEQVEGARRYSGTCERCRQRQIAEPTAAAAEKTLRQHRRNCQPKVIVRTGKARPKPEGAASSIVEPSEHTGHCAISVGWLYQRKAARAETLGESWTAVCERCSAQLNPNSERANAEKALRGHRLGCHPKVRV